jgi:hypothetical protein
LLVKVADNIIIIPSFENTQSVVAAMKTAADNLIGLCKRNELETRLVLKLLLFANTTISFNSLFDKVS